MYLYKSCNFYTGMNTFVLGSVSLILRVLYAQNMQYKEWITIQILMPWPDKGVKLLLNVVKYWVSPWAPSLVRILKLRLKN